MRHTYSYIVDFRGGIYCSQVVSKDLKSSLQSWLVKINKQKSEIKYLGESTLKDIANIIKDTDYNPVMLQGLNNIWVMQIPTKTGLLNIHIIQTEIT